MHWYLKFYFGNETLHVSDSSSVHHQELFTVHSAMVYVIQVCRQLSSRITVPSWSCPKAVYKPVWHIPLLNVQWITSDDGQRIYPKHVEFHFQNKIWEISKSSWFYHKEICHDAGHMNVKKKFDLGIYFSLFKTWLNIVPYLQCLVIICSLIMNTFFWRDFLAADH
jgi:hypothetical protein